MTDTVTIPIHSPFAAVPDELDRVSRLADIVQAELELYGVRWSMGPEDLAAVLSVVRSRMGLPGKGAE